MDAVQHLWRVKIAVAVWQTEAHTISSVWVMKKKTQNKIIAIYLFIYISLYSMFPLSSTCSSHLTDWRHTEPQNIGDMATRYRQGRATNRSSSRSMCVPPLWNPLRGTGGMWLTGEHFTDKLMSRFWMILIETILEKSTLYLQRTLKLICSSKFPDNQIGPLRFVKREGQLMAH